MIDKKTFVHRRALDNFMKRVAVLSLLTLVISLAGATTAMAQADVFTAKANGNWNVAGTWTKNSGSGAQTFPIAGDTANIPSGFTVTIVSGRPEACAILTINSTSGTTEANLTFASGTSSLAVSGNVTMNAGSPTILNGTQSANITMNGAQMTIGGALTLNSGSGGRNYVSELNFTGGGIVTVGGAISVNVGAGVSSVVDMTGGGTLNVGSSLTVGGTFTPGTTTGTVVYDGTAAQTITTTRVSYNNLTIDDSGATATPAGTLTIGNNLTVASGTLDLLTDTANGTLGGAVLTVANGATLRVGAANFPASYSTYSLGASSTVNYYETTAQTVSAQTYGNLTLSGGGAKTVTSATVNGILLMAGTATTTGTPTYGPAATLEYGGTALQTTGSEFPSPWNGSGGVIINNASGVKFAAAKTINAPLTIDAGQLNLNGVASSASTLFFGASQQGSGVWGGTGTLGVLGVNVIDTHFSSEALTVSFGLATQLVFTQPPATTAPGVTMANVVVTEEDSNGHTVTSDSSTSVTLTFGANPGGGTLSGTTMLTLSSGVATFSTLSINNAGSGYTLVATDGALHVTSNPFNILKGTPIFSGLTASQSITYGSTVTLSGTLSASGPVYPANGDPVSVTINGITQNALISGGAGGFSINFTTAGIPFSVTPYTITYGYAGDPGLNAALSDTSTALTVNKKALTAQGTLSAPSSKVYDGTIIASVSGAAALQPSEAFGSGSPLDGKPYNLDAVSLTGSASYAYNGQDVATASAITNGGLSLTGAASVNYTLVAPSLDATITAKPLTAGGNLAFPASKVYDGTTTATLISGAPALQNTESTGTGTTADGIPYTGDDVSLTGTDSYNYNVKDVGATTITESGLSLGGAQAGDYSLTAPTFAATITTKTLTESGLTAPPSKVYDDTTIAAVGGTPTLLLAEAAGTGTTSDGTPYIGDILSFSGPATGTYDSKGVATATMVTFGGISLGGAQAVDYTLIIQSSVPAVITAKALTALGTLVFPASKVYDGTTTATLTSGSAALQAPEVGAFGTAGDGKPYNLDAVSLTGSASYAYNGQDVATASAITNGGLSLTGAASVNYMLTPPSLPATITAKPLTAGGSLAFPASKVYDGTTTATPTGSAALQTSENTGTGTAADGIPYTGDDVSLTGTDSYNYNVKDVGATTIIEGGLSLIGAQAGDYSLTAPTFAATITTKTLTESGLTVPASKVYDGTTKAAVGGTPSLLPAEAAGTGTTGDGMPYIGDILSFSGPATGTYDSKDVVTASAVTFGGISLGGAQAVDYTLIIQGSASATITAKALTAVGTLTFPASKVYDGTTTATPTGSAALQTAENAGTGTTADGKPYITDTVSLTGTASYNYNVPDVGATTIAESGLSLTEATAGDYTLTAPSFSPKTITAKPLTAGGTLAFPASKVYDGTTAATPISGAPALQTSENTGTGTAADGIPYTGDDVSLTGTAIYNYNVKDVGATTIMESGLSLMGAKSVDYSLTAPTFSATITPKALNYGNVTANNKPYDGTVAATLTGPAQPLTAEAPGTGSSGDGEPYTGDTVTFSAGPYTGTFASASGGTGITVTLTGGLTVSPFDYSVGSSTTPFTADITRATPTFGGLTGSQTIVYGTPSVTLSGVLSATGPIYPANGEAISVTIGSTTVPGTIGNNGAFSVVFPTGAIPVTGSPFTITYTYNDDVNLGDASDGSTTLTVNPLPVNLMGTRVYDATTVAMSSILTINNIVGSDNVTLSGNGALAAADVGSEAISTGATPVRVQGVTGAIAGTATTSFNVNLATPANGDTLIAVVSTRSTTVNAVASIAETGATWTRAAQSSANTTEATTTEIWYASGVSGAGTTVTIHLSGSMFASAVIMEYSGLLTPGTLDVTANNLSTSTGSTAANTGTTATTSQANEVWIGGIGLVNSGYTLSSFLNSFSLVTSSASGGSASSNAKVYALEKIVTSTGTAITGGTVSTSSKWSGAVATFQAVLETGTPLTLGGSQAANYTLVGLSGSVSITPKALIYTGVTANSKQYDGTATATFTGNATLSAEAPGAGTASDGMPYTGDAVTLSAEPYTGTFASANVGTSIAVTLNGGLTLSASDTADYSLTPQSYSADITRATPTFSGLTASQTNVYGTPSVTLSGVLSATGPIYPANGEGISVKIGSTTVPGTIGNNGAFSVVFPTGTIPAGSYTITYSYADDVDLGNASDGSTTLTISPLPLLLGGTRTYDATTTAAASVLTINNLQNSDSVTLSGSVPLAGNDVPSQAILSNPSALVQSLSGNTTASGGASSFSVTLNNAPVVGDTLIAVISTHTSTEGVTGVAETGVTTWARAASSIVSGTDTEIWYATLVSGTPNKSITISMPSGTHGAATIMEYSGLLTASPLDQIATSTGTSSSGNPVAVTGNTPSTTQATELWVGGIGLASTTPTVSGFLNGFNSVTATPATSSGGSATVNARVYALTNAVTAEGIASSGGTVSVNGTAWSGVIATFQAAALTSLTISGANSGNYTLVGMTGSVNISPKALTYTGVTANSKQYDGTTAATFTGNATPLAAEGPGVGTTSDGKPYMGDAVAFSAEPYTGTFASANVGTAIPVTLTGGLTISASDPADYTITPQAFSANITGPPSQLVMKTEPSSSVTAGGAFATEPAVFVEDSFGNVVTTDNTSTVTVGVQTGIGPMTGAQTVTVINGVAMFNGLDAPTTAQTGLMLTFTDAGDGGLTLNDGTSITVNPGALNHFAISAISSPQTAGTPITGITFTAQDSFNNTVTSFSGAGNTVSYSGTAGITGISPTFLGGVLSGVSVTPIVAGSSETFIVTGGSPGKTGTATFAVNPGLPSKLAMKTEPSATVTAGAAFATEPVVNVEDAFNNVVTTDNTSTVTVGVQTGTGPMTGTMTVTVVNGVATFIGLDAPTKSQTGLKLDFTDAGDGISQLNDGTPITVNPAALDHFSISAISSPQTAGTAITGVTLTAQDIFNNTVTTFTGTGNTVTYGGTAGITGTSGNFASGVLVVSVTPTVAGSSMTFIVTSSSGKTGTATFAVNPGAASAYRITATTTTPTAGSGDQLTITQVDKNGNTETSFTGNETLTFSGLANSPLPAGNVPTIANSTGAAINEGTAETLAFTAGVSVLTGGQGILVAYDAQTALLAVQDSSGLKTTSAGGAGVTLTVGASTGTQLVFTTSPGNGTGGVALPTQPVVKVEDQYNNTVTSSSASVALAITPPVTGGPGILAGTSTKAAASGVATFTGLSVNTVGTGYQLTATSPGLTSATSTAFNITAGSVASYIVTTTPTTPTEGVSFTVTVTAVDAGGNVTVDNTTVTLTDSTGDMQFTPGTGVPGSDGIFTVSAVDNYYETDTITAKNTTLKTGTDVVVINPTAAAAGDYQSINTGAWNTVSTWQVWNGTMWVAATSAPTSSTTNLIAVQGGFVVTVTNSVTAQNLFVVGGSTVTISNNQTFTVFNGIANGTISDGSLNNGILVESGVGNSLTLNGNNSYGGGTVINGGKITITNMDSSSTPLNLGTGKLTFSGGGILDDLSDVGAGNAQTYTGTITLNAGGGVIEQLGIPGNTITLTGTISGGNGLQLAGSDVILEPTGNNNIGPITVGASPYLVDSTLSRLFVDSLGSINNSSLTIQSGAVLDFSTGGANAPVNTITFQSGAAVSTRSGALTLSTAHVTFPTTGTMIFDFDDQTSQNITVNGYPALTGPLTIQVGGLNTSVGTTTLTGPISGSGPITKTSTGELILSGANTYTGGTVVSGGTLDASVSGSLGTGDALVSSGATLQLDSSTAMATAARLIIGSQSLSAVSLTSGINQSLAGLSFNGGTSFQTAGSFGATGSGATTKVSPPFVTGHTGILTIGSKTALTVTALANTKVYDATTSAAATPTPTPVLLHGLDTAVLTETYNSKDVGTGKTLTPLAVITDTLGINVNADYTITYVINTAGVITAKPLNYAGVTANNKIYDGTTAATFTGNATPLTAEAPGSGTSSDGLPYTGDSVGFTLEPYAGTFATANVGTAIPVTLTSVLALTGGQAVDYSAGTTASAYSANITVRSLSITANNQTKTYGQTLTFGTGGTLFTSSGLQNSETIGSVTLTCIGGAANAPVSGSPYTITPSAATGGSFNPANYTITYNNGTLTVNVLAVSLTGTRAYDGTAIADSSILSIANAVSGDDVGLSGSATLTNSATGLEPITVVSGLTLTGTTAPNYTLTGYSGSVLITPIGPPVASPATYTRAKNTELIIDITAMLSTYTSDSSGDAVVLVSVNDTPLAAGTFTTTANGSTFFYTSSYEGTPHLLFTSPNNNNETIDYEVADASFPIPAFSTGSTITINAQSATGQQTGSITVSAGVVTTTWAGVPGDDYVVQVTSDISDPNSWEDVSGILTAPSGGVFSFIDSNPPTPTAYYRLRQN